MSEQATLHISKIDAAKRQLETALRLFFNNADPISIHTLASAAREVLEVLAVKNGTTPFRKEMLEKRIKPEHKKSVARTLDKAYNYFKHGAKDDPAQNLSFRPELNEFVLYECCDSYRLITTERVPLFELYELYFLQRHPAAVMNDDYREKILDLGEMLPSRSDYLKILPALESRYI